MEFTHFRTVPEAKKLYGLYTRAEHSGLRTSCCGKNCGGKGKPNVVFHLPDTSAPNLKDGKICNILQGLKLPELVQTLYDGFGDDTWVILGDRIATDKHVSTHCHLYVTLDPALAKYILVADKRHAHDNRKIPGTLKKVAEHCCFGAPVENSPEFIYWDYYIFPLMMVYRSNASEEEIEVMRNGSMVAMQERQQIVQKCLLEMFGEFVDSPWTPVSGAKVSKTVTAQTGTQTAEDMGDKIRITHYDDGLRHEQGWVIDKHGRLLTPKTDIDKASSFIDATVACREEWDYTKGCLAIKYLQECLSSPAKFTIVRKPDRLTVAQLDRLQILEKFLENKRSEYAKACGVPDLMVLQTQDGKGWYDQLNGHHS